MEATSVFPQSVFTDVQLKPELENILPDGRIILNLDEGNVKENTPLISMTLFGRKFGQDGPPPEQWCPRKDGEGMCLNKRCTSKQELP